jgi:citrate synthase
LGYSITYIDGDAGEPLYRGYPVEQLAEGSSYLEVADLLISGTLPTKAKYKAFRDSITRHAMVNSRLLRLFQGFHHDAHPMAMLSAVVALNIFFAVPCEPYSIDLVAVASRLIR